MFVIKKNSIVYVLGNHRIDPAYEACDSGIDAIFVWTATAHSSVHHPMESPLALCVLAG